MSSPQNRQPGKTDPVIPNPSSMRTRCALLTGLGRSAVAVVAVEGRDAIQVVAKCFRGIRHGDLAPGQVRYGTWVGPNQADPNQADPDQADPDQADPDQADPDQADPDHDIAGESVVVTLLDEGGVEIHCHGGPAATERIVADLQACGVTAVDSKGWSLGDPSRLIGEARAVLARCLTSRTAAIAMDQLRGAMLHWASSRLESVTRADVAVGVIQREAEEILRLAPLGLRLTDPFRIVLIGPPNVGKSSLLNAIVGYDRSITFDGAGTTRDVLHAETVIDGWPVRLSDTAGIRESGEPIEREGMVRARFAADQADLLLCVSEPALLDPIGGNPIGGNPIGGNPIGGEAFAPFEPSATQKIPTIRLLNKSDLWRREVTPVNDPRPDSKGRESENARGFDLFTSVRTGAGMDELMSLIADRLGQFLPEPGAPVPITERQFESLLEISRADGREQLENALNSLLGFVTISEEP